MYTRAPNSMWSWIELFFVPLHIDEKFILTNLFVCSRWRWSCSVHLVSEAHYICLQWGRNSYWCVSILYAIEYKISALYTQKFLLKSYHVIHVDYIDKLQHDFISPICCSMKLVNTVYSLIVNPVTLIFLSDYLLLEGGYC